MDSNIQADANFLPVPLLTLDKVSNGLGEISGNVKLSQQLSSRTHLDELTSELLISWQSVERKLDASVSSNTIQPAARLDTPPATGTSAANIIPNGSFGWVSQQNVLELSVTRSEKSDSPGDRLTGLQQGQPLVGSADVGTRINNSEVTILQVSAPPFPGRLLKYVPGHALMRGEDVRQWQAQMRNRGWRIDVDGVYGRQSAQICRQFQQEKGLQSDGIVGSQTWNAVFTLPIHTPNPSPGGTGSINQKGLDIVKKYEGLRLKAYRDPVGIWTIGYGHTGPEVGPGDVITRQQAETLLRKDLARFEKSVRDLVKVKLTSNQFSALVSFSFNVGAGSLQRSTLLKKLNRGDYQGAANEFPRWNKAGGTVLPGLTRRRAEERQMFLT